MEFCCWFLLLQPRSYLLPEFILFKYILNHFLPKTDFNVFIVKAHLQTGLSTNYKTQNKVFLIFPKIMKTLSKQILNNDNKK